jgi:prepilin-type processing-associated H-X9-DG protein
MFMTYTTPNSKQADWIVKECQYPFGLNPPCVLNNPSSIAARSFHPGGVNALLADGSVKFFKNSINIQTWRAVSTPNGGEVVSADAY